MGFSVWGLGFEGFLGIRVPGFRDWGLGGTALGWEEFT